MLSLPLGFGNTIALIASRLHHGHGGWSAQTSQKNCPSISDSDSCSGFPVLHWGKIKVTNTSKKKNLITHLIPGADSFDITYCSKNPSAVISQSKDLDDEKKEIKEGIEVERTERKSEASAKSVKKSVQAALNAHAQSVLFPLFWMTGLHALHMIVGAGLLLLYFGGTQRQVRCELQHSSG